MKKIIQLIIIVQLLFANFINAQCKLEVDKIDEFKKVRVRETDDQKVAETFGGTTWLQVFQIDTFIFLKYGMYDLGITSTFVPAGAELLIKTNNDSIITLKNSESKTGEFIKMSNMDFTHTTCDYPITIEQLKYLLSNAPTKLRWVVSDRNYENNIKPNKWEKLKQKLNCFVEIYTKLPK